VCCKSKSRREGGIRQTSGHNCYVKDKNQSQSDFYNRSHAGVIAGGTKAAKANVTEVEPDSPLCCRSESVREGGSRQTSGRSTHTSEGSLETETEAGGSASGGEGGGEGSGEEEGGLTLMSSLCPLWDEMLPLDASCLKAKQV